jgi:hypothetical protein
MRKILSLIVLLSLMLASSPDVQAAGAGPKTFVANAVALVPVAAATDIVTLAGSTTATKVVRVKRVSITGTQTTGGQVTIQLIRRSAVNTGGTSSGITAAKFDTNYTYSASMLAWTANPTGLGASAGVVDVQTVYIGTTTTTGDIYIWTPGSEPNQAFVLKTSSDLLAVSLGGATVTGGSLNVSIQWTEEAP